MCLEKRVFYRVISGMHASINTHLSAQYLFKGRYNVLRIIIRLLQWKFAKNKSHIYSQRWSQILKAWSNEDESWWELARVATLIHSHHISSSLNLLKFWRELVRVRPVNSYQLSPHLTGAWVERTLVQTLASQLSSTLILVWLAHESWENCRANSSELHLYLEWELGCWKWSQRWRKLTSIASPSLLFFVFWRRFKEEYCGFMNW